MIQENHHIQRLEKENKRIRLFAVLIAAFVLLAAWTIDIILHRQNVSFYAIYEIHRLNPALFLFEILPFAAWLLMTLYIRRQRETFKRIHVFQQNQDKTIQKNIEFAQRIGQGDFSVDFTNGIEKDTLSESLLVMRDNLASIKQKEEDQAWMAIGKEKISSLLRNYNSVNDLAYPVLKELTDYTGMVQALFYIYDEKENMLRNQAAYAYNRNKIVKQEFSVGRGLIGQAAYEKDMIYRTEIPDDYVTITSGILGDKKPCTLLIVPLMVEEKLQGVIEFADIKHSIPPITKQFIREISTNIARSIFNLKTNAQTEQLLQESRQMTEELQENEEELRQNAEEMRATQEELEKANIDLAKKMEETRNAHRRLHGLLENASEIISIYDEKMKLNFVSPSVTKILGYTPEEMQKGRDMNRLSMIGEEQVQNMFKSLLEDPAKSVTIEYTYMRKDGAKAFLETTGRNFLEDPAIRGIVLNSSDITERRRAEKQERLKSKMRSLSENSLDLIMRIGLRKQIFYVNPVFYQLTGIDNQTAYKSLLEELNFNEKVREVFLEAVNTLKKTKKNHITEYIFPVKDEEKIMRLKAIPEFNDEGDLETFLLVSHDITEAKRIEREIKETNKKISESINYAERIQHSILPNNKVLRDHFPNSFIYYAPRDKVSGDFPWFFKKGDVCYVAVVDCTGHGVPGALLSFVAYFLLNNIVDHSKTYSASRILDFLHIGVRRTLNQEREDADARDGMDIALCKINTKTNSLEFAGAHRPLYLLRKGKLMEYKGDRKPIGGIPAKKRKEKNFTNHPVKLLKNDKIFIFSDGLTDQTGGTKGKKYQATRIKDALIKNPDLTMTRYASFFAKDFLLWKGKYKQIDDVLLIGIEF